MKPRACLVASVTPITRVVLHYVEQVLTESNPINKTH